MSKMKQIPDLRFYNFNFELLHIENRYTSANWSLTYNDIGTFECHFAEDSEVLAIVMNNDYLVVVQGEKAAIITGKILANDLAIFGRTCNWLLTKRTTQAFEKEEKLTTDWTCKFVCDAFDNVTNFNIDSFEPTASISTISMERGDRCQTFGLVQECLQEDNLGHEVKFDINSGQWLFRILQEKEAKLVISTANRNAYDVSTMVDALNYCSDGWYKRKLEDMGEWLPNSNSLTDNKPENYGKYWKVGAAGSKWGITFDKGDYLVCRRLSGKLEKSDKTDSVWTYLEKDKKGGIYRWEEILSGGNESEAVADIVKKLRANTVQAKTRDLFFGADYHLGDIVRIQNCIGTEMQSFTKKIVGVNLWYESGNIGEEPVFEDVD